MNLLQSIVFTYIHIDNDGMFANWVCNTYLDIVTGMCAMCDVEGNLFVKE